MADETKPSTLEMLAALAGKLPVQLTIAGQVISLGAMALSELAHFIDTSGADKTELEKTHAEYQRRIAIARDPTS